LLLVAFLLVNAHLVLASVVQGDGVNCDSLVIFDLTLKYKS